MSFSKYYFDNHFTYNYNGKEQYYDQHLTPNDTGNRVLDVGGIGYQFRLGGYGGSYPYIERPYGDIYVRATRGAYTAGPITLTYAHAQFTISATPSFTIPSGGSLTITSVGNYDKFTVGDTIHY